MSLRVNPPQKSLRVSAGYIRNQAAILKSRYDKFIREAERLEALSKDKAMGQDAMRKHAQDAEDRRLNWLAFPL